MKSSKKYRKYSLLMNWVEKQVVGLKTGGLGENREFFEPQLTDRQGMRGYACIRGA